MPVPKTEDQKHEELIATIKAAGDEVTKAIYGLNKCLMDVQLELVRIGGTLKSPAR